ncbi:hypothetical protein cypCar_00000266, partial [Cyprinus carpio]
VLFAPVRMIMVPPRHYCVVLNPVARNDEGQVQFDASGQAKLRHADLEIRLTQDPFPLYPGCDATATNPTDNSPASVSPAANIRRRGKKRVTQERCCLRDQNALHVRALRLFRDAGGRERRTGEEWLVTAADREAHIPSVAEEVVGVVDVTTLNSRQYCVVLDPVGADGKPQLGQKRVVKGERSFFLRPGERLENGIQDVYVLSEEEGLVLRAVEAFIDTEGTQSDRMPLVLQCPSPPYTNVCHCYSLLLSFTPPPHTSMLQQEELDEEEEGESRAKKRGIQRRPGDRWMLRGPVEYVPPATVEVLLRRNAIPLDENEGIYVRDIKTGKARFEVYKESINQMQSSFSDVMSVSQVRAVIGQTYMLTQDEELWEKVLPANVETLLSQSRDPLADRSERGVNFAQTERDKTRVVSYRVPHNAAIQVYDYREKKARVVFGPEMVMLGPDEQFTILSLSGDKPKRPNVIKTICLLLGPDFCTDIIIIETADHARLQLQLSYNWHFDIKQPVEAATATALFSVPDFVGDACKAIASRIRGAVASVQFDDFHKNSNRIICSAVFGFDEKLAVRSSLRFNQNGLVISSVDIQSVEPVDQRTRDALQKSVQLAIEITTNSQEATARHEAERLEQEARGRLERQRITDQAEAEKARKELLELEAQSAAVESTGAAKAEAQSRAEAARIQGEAAVEEAKLKAEAQKIEADAELARLCKAREQELNYKKEMDQLEVEKQQKLAGIESQRFKQLMESLGTETLKEMARAGPELQVKLLQSLGLKSTLITDGSSPINLFTTANGLLGALQGKEQDEK